MSNARNLSQGETRFVNTSGDTMTGDLSVTGGNVGIGTSPSTPLDVTKANGGNFVATFQNTSSSTPYGVFIKDAPSGANGYPLLQVTNSAGSAHYFRVDSGTGHVTMPYQPAFHAYGSGSSINASGTTIINYATELFDEGGNYNTSNGRFTAPVAGKYMFGWTSIGNNQDSVYRYYILINGFRPYGADVHLRQDVTATGSEYGTNAMYCIPVSLSANDYVQIEVTNDSAQSWYGSGDSTNEYWRFWGYLIG